MRIINNKILFSSGFSLHNFLYEYPTSSAQSQVLAEP